MPIYEYQCQSCGHRFEEMQRISDPALTTCPQCEGELKKLVSAPAFQFKGSGWYATDYAGKKGGGGSTDGTAKSDGDSSSADKSTATKTKSDSAGSGSSANSSKES